MIVTVLSHSVLQRGWTALMLAGSSGHTHVVQLLLSSEAQVDLQDKVRDNINYFNALNHIAFDRSAHEQNLLSL